MKYVRILADAWELTTQNKKLTWFIFVPSVAAIILFIAEVSWQYVLLGEEFGWIEHGRMYDFIGTSIISVYSSGMTWLVVSLIAVGALLLFVLKPWIEATLILSIGQKYSFPDKRLSLRKQISKGHEYFVSLLEYHALLAPFAPISILLYAASFYRYTHGSDTYYDIFLPILLILSVFSVFVHFFFVFVPFYLVNDKGELFKSLVNSMGLVFRHFGKTVALFLVKILVSLRIIVNVLVVVGVPVGLISVATYFAASDYYTLFLIFAGILSLVLVAGAGYLTAVLEVFSTSFWYRAFQVFKAIDQDELEQEEETEIQEEKVVEVIKPQQPQQKVKVVHVMHHVQAGEQSLNKNFTDLPGEVVEIEEDLPREIKEDIEKGLR